MPDVDEEAALTTSHLQGAVLLLQLLQRFGELLPSLFLQSRACKRREERGEHVLVCRTGGEQERGKVDVQTDRQTDR